jgi:hypothetical protein
MEPLQVLTAWALAAMTSWLPYSRHLGEPLPEVESRYQAIAEAAIAANYDPSSRPMAWGSRAASTILTLSVAEAESSFRADVFTGIGPHARGDNGQSFCPMQVKLGDGTIAVGDEEWSGDDLLADPNKCFLAGVQKLRGSLGTCPELEFRDRLSAYITGQCKPLNWRSRMRIDRAVEWVNAHHPPVKDSDVLATMAKAGEPGAEAKL